MGLKNYNLNQEWDVEKKFCKFQSDFISSFFHGIQDPFLYSSHLFLPNLQKKKRKILKFNRSVKK